MELVLFACFLQCYSMWLHKLCELRRKAFLQIRSRHPCHVCILFQLNWMLGKN